MHFRSNMAFKVILSFTLMASSLGVSAFEIIPIESNITIVSRDNVTTRQSAVPNLKVATSVIAPNNVNGQIRFNRRLGLVSLTILSPTKSLMKIKWDNPDSMFSRFDAQNVIFVRPGASRQISFNVTKPISGSLYIYNSENKLLKQIPYNVKKQRKYQQSLQARTFKTDTDSISGSDQNVSLDYSFSRRASIGQPVWRGGITLRSELDDDDGHDDKSTGLYFGVTW